MIEEIKSEESPTQFFGIVPQTQPTGTTCIQACIAMALGVNVEKVIKRWGSAALNQEWLHTILTQCGILWNSFSIGTLIYEGWYFAVVPSLNHRGGSHQILIHFSFDTGMLVIDPAIGNKYKQDGSDLISWGDLTPFIPGGRFPE